MTNGGVALFPADGLYGLACDPLNGGAIERIHEIKGRDDGKPSAVMYFDPLMMRELLADMGPATRRAVAALMPGPVTLVVDNPAHHYPLACRATPERLGIRLIEGPLAGAGTPIFQTSANRSGDEAPASFADVDPAIAAGVDLAIDGGELTGLAVHRHRPHGSRRRRGLGDPSRGCPRRSRGRGTVGGYSGEGL